MNGATVVGWFETIGGTWTVYVQYRIGSVRITVASCSGPGNSSIGNVVSFSPDNGDSWFLLLVGDEITPSLTGNQLRYKVEIDSDPNGDFSPDVSFVEIAYAI